MRDRHKLRFILASLVIVALTAVTACGGDDENPPPSPDSAAGTPDGGGGGGPDSAVGTPDSGGNGAAPVIESVTWDSPEGCQMGILGPFTFTFTVTDADTPAPGLTFSGSVQGCTGQLNMTPVTIQCPNAAPYGGMVTVTDPEGNSASQNFTISPCTDGSAP